MNREEGALHQAVADFLRVGLPMNAAFYSIPNERVKPTSGEVLRLVRQGMLIGAPDLCVVYGGRALFIELKSKKGYLTKEQRLAHKRLTQAGAVCATCRSVEDVAHFLDSNSMSLRARVTA